MAADSVGLGNGMRSSHPAVKYSPVINDHTNYNVLLAVEEVLSHPHLIVPISSQSLWPPEQWTQHPAQHLPGPAALVLPCHLQQLIPTTLPRASTPSLVSNAKSAVYIAVLWWSRNFQWGDGSNSLGFYPCFPVVARGPYKVEINNPKLKLYSFANIQHGQVKRVLKDRTILTSL